MNWILLTIAGLLEIVWAIGLKSAGLKQPPMLALVVAAMVASFILLSLAMRSIPVGTAYGVWVGIGVLGTVIGGAILFHEPLSPARILFLAMLLVSIIGLKLS